jgi:hypothetical protein
MSIVQIKIKTLYRLCAVILVLITASGCAAKFTVKTEPISGKVVDAETNEPIEEVIVIGYWPGYSFYFEQYPVGTIELLEVVTDKEGNYFVPGWLKESIDSSFRYGDPVMIFYKTGYEIEIESNAFSMGNFKKMPGYFHPWHAEWDGKTIKMNKFKGDNRAYRAYLNVVQYSAPYEDIFNYCKFMNVPRLLIAMEEYYKTQPDYWMPGRTLTVGEMVPVSEYRKKSQIDVIEDVQSPAKASPETKPLPSILTITQLENIGRRCEVTPIEYLKRITRNEKDFIRSSDGGTSANK